MREGGRGAEMDGGRRDAVTAYMIPSSCQVNVHRLGRALPTVRQNHLKPEAKQSTQLNQSWGAPNLTQLDPIQRSSPSELGREVHNVAHLATSDSLGRRPGRKEARGERNMPS